MQKVTWALIDKVYATVPYKSEANIDSGYGLVAPGSKTLLANADPDLFAIRRHWARMSWHIWDMNKMSAILHFLRPISLKNSPGCHWNSTKIWL